MVSGTAASVAVFIATSIGFDDAAGMIGGGVGGAVAAVMVTLGKTKDGGGTE
ncbi:MAG: hypothetical protein VX589_05005 [Myxococcota bacterium]|nr:hypothetical protein [Myxococcota bacterium]